MQENNNSKNHIIIQKKTKKYVEVCYNMEIIDAKTLDYKAINEALRRSDDACTIQNCCGQRFLASGMSQKDLTIYGIPGNALGAYLNNAAITVYGNGAGALTIGGNIIQISEIDEYVTLDSDTQNAYKGTANKNSTVSLATFPVLQPGKTGISWSGGITKVEITPRWWTV